MADWELLVCKLQTGGGKEGSANSRLVEGKKAVQTPDWWRERRQCKLQTDGGKEGSANSSNCNKSHCD